MKANIDTKNIGNRKFILELRFDHKGHWLKVLKMLIYSLSPIGK